ncbi:tetratricopeptide repeat domain-containing protein [Exophiala viscosa]|uniref:tetratricopeptide repeat domain-containing protein n=1 Tax=Exophiala viscosa TaxID=2486360 RepID=UPI00219325A6|nr:tetratricopeptide repeat domain-containing protein [Exophiala viscosa]
MYQRVLQGNEKGLGMDDALTLDTVNNLGLLYRNQGKLAQAEAMYQRALHGFEKALGKEHTTTLDTVNNLGTLFDDQGKLEQAEAMYRPAWQGYEKALGEDLVDQYVRALNTCENLAHFLVLQGQPVEVTELFQRALAGLKKVWGSSHERCRHLESAITSINPQQGFGIDTAAAGAYLEPQFPHGVRLT